MNHPLTRRLLLGFTLFTAGACLVPTLAAEGYAHPEMLVETAWVAEHGSGPKMRLVDMRSATAYGEGHIPGAVSIDEGPLKNTADRETYLPAPEVFQGLMEHAGISNDTRVIIYDDRGGQAGARLWYVLNAYGHTNVALVNGGWQKWVAEQRPVSHERPAAAPAQFHPRLTPTLSCPSSEVLARKPGVVVLDTRSPAEARAGRIPGSVNVDWRENVTGPDHVFKSAAELKALYAGRGSRRTGRSSAIAPEAAARRRRSSR